MTISREITTQLPRDNMIFEIGLFVGGIERNRTCIAHNRAEENKIPSDLAGISMAS